MLEMQTVISAFVALANLRYISALNNNNNNNNNIIIIIIITEFTVSLRLSVSLSCCSAQLHCAKTAENIRILFAVNTLVGLRSIVLNDGPDLPHSDTAFAKLLWPLFAVFATLR